MPNKIIKDAEARTRLENWYQTFLQRIDLPVESRTISTSYGSQHMLVAGDRSKPPLIALHAMLTSSAHLLSEIETLVEQFYIIAPDLPGQSVRGVPKRLPYDDNSHAHWLQEVLNALDLEKVNLFGVSLGGFVARQYASTYPENIKKLSLLVPAGIVQGSVLKGMVKMAMPMIMYKISPTEKHLRKLVDNLITTWDDDWAHYLGDVFNDFTVSFKIPPLASDAELNNLSMPCLVMAAENDISFPGRPLIERVEAQVPHVETELIENSRHCPPTTEEFQHWLANRLIRFF